MLLLGNGTNWWAVLGVNRTASRAEIVNAYRALAKIHHPDIGGDPEQFKRLRAVYEIALKEREK
ncbi:MAG TPA: J domain-containing protein [Anaerolineae bacterium]|nr:J domain-containing protein [Anaerolineae bacterium]